jgi:hypothetical protein
LIKGSTNPKNKLNANVCQRFSHIMEMIQPK